jgi:hypothetical protein
VIYDFALEPELVATWHDRRVAYPILCQMGLGQRRVPCSFPFAAWNNLVMSAFRSIAPEAGTAAFQQARKNIEVLLRHLHETSTRRNGKLNDGETWLDAALREHGEFPFGGILVRTFDARHDDVVAADRISETDFPAWSPTAPPTLRDPEALARALAPVLRSPTELRFIDPYFDAADLSFFEPMRKYLLTAQRRRTIAGLRLQIHFAVRAEETEQASRISGRRLKESDIAQGKLDACERLLSPLLEPGVAIRAFAWGQATTGVRMHNRYVLSEVGGIMLGTGLDRTLRGEPQTDDLTVLSKEQHAARWSEFSDGALVHRLIAKRVIAHAPAGSR